MRHAMPVLFVLFHTILSLTVFSDTVPLTQEEREEAQRKWLPLAMEMGVTHYADGKFLLNYYGMEGDDPAFLEYTGTTLDQYRQFKEETANFMEDYKPLFREYMRKIAYEKDRAEVRSIFEEFMIDLNDLYSDKEEALQRILSPEQIDKIRECILPLSHTASEMGLPLVDFDAYRALGFSEKQEKEFERFKEEQIGMMKKFMQELAAIYDGLESVRDPKERQKRLMELHPKVMAKQEEGKKLQAGLQARIRMQLTAEQVEKLNRLIENPPEFVKKRNAKWKENPKPVDESQYQDWKKTWKPGDKIPDEFYHREKRSRKVFPMPM